MPYSPLIILAAVLIYGFVHSLLASLGVKARLKQVFGRGTDRWYRLAYNAFAVITLLPILALPLLLDDMPLYRIPPPWLYFTTAVQVMALIGLGIGLLQTGIWSFLGFKQLLDIDQNQPPQMLTGGLYNWVRHPLYTAGLILIWMIPVMTYNLLALNLGLTVYLILGAIYEERKLVREFGDEYISYQGRVPMLIPGLVRRQPSGGTED
jgi:protein-S-isoprenylcysteine O-methyltransferase Ste14